MPATLEFLFLDNNHLNGSNLIFPPHRKLKAVYIAGNRMTSLPETAFVNLEDVHLIDLYNNSFTSGFTLQIRVPSNQTNKDLNINSDIPPTVVMMSNPIDELSFAAARLNRRNLPMLQLEAAPHIQILENAQLHRAHAILITKLQTLPMLAMRPKMASMRVADVRVKFNKAGATFKGPLKGSTLTDHLMNTVEMGFRQLFVLALSISCVLAQNDSSTTLALSDVNETTLTLSTATILDVSNSTFAQKVSDLTDGTTISSKTISSSTVTPLSTDSASLCIRLADTVKTHKQKDAVSSNVTVSTFSLKRQIGATSTTVVIGQKDNGTLIIDTAYSTLEPASTSEIFDANELRRLSTTTKVSDLTDGTTTSSSQPILSSTVTPVLTDAASVATPVTDNKANDVSSTNDVNTDVTVAPISSESQTESAITTLMIAPKENVTLINDTVHSTLEPASTLEAFNDSESNLTDAANAVTTAFDDVSISATESNSVNTDVTVASVSSESQTILTSTTVVFQQQENNTLINDAVHTTLEPVSTMEFSTELTRLLTTSATSKNLKTTTALPLKKVLRTTTTLSPLPSRNNNHRQSFESNEYHYDRNGVKHNFKHLPDVSQETDVVVIETPYGPVFIPFDKQTIRKIINKNRHVRRGNRRSAWQ
uniref:LRRCT domain-containing protein n=1 Tax=Panagrellus redivivus TaxID=6233 RepID=A0A7E4W2S1_PANRE